MKVSLLQDLDKHEAKEREVLEGVDGLN